jgi:hypothetical protein
MGRRCLGGVRAAHPALTARRHSKSREDRACAGGSMWMGL